MTLEQERRMFDNPNNKHRRRKTDKLYYIYSSNLKLPILLVLIVGIIHCTVKVM